MKVWLTTYPFGTIQYINLADILSLWDYRIDRFGRHHSPLILRDSLAWEATYPSGTVGQVALVDTLQPMLPGQVFMLLCGAQLAVAGLRGHKQGLLEAQALGSQRCHEGLQQRLWIALLHTQPQLVSLQLMCYRLWLSTQTRLISYFAHLELQGTPSKQRWFCSGEGL